ncbi:MAG: helix-turn-helix transcriptional regulator [Planctomycetaceae bacterium]
MDSISRHEQLLRVFHLIDILFGARQPLSTGELKERLRDRGVIDEMSDKSIRRDVEFLERFGYAVKESKKRSPRGGSVQAWSIQPGRGAAELAAPAITLPELLSLAVARDFLAPLAGTVYWRGIAQVIAKLERIATPELLAYVHEHQEGLVVHPRPAAGKYRSKTLNAIHRAIQGSRELEIRYTSLADRAPRKSVIRPEALVVYDGSIYVAAYRAGGTARGASGRAADGIRFFKLDRVADARVSSRTFDRRPVPVADLLVDSITMFRSPEAPRRYRVRVDASLARWAVEKPFHPRQRVRRQPDGGLVLEIERAWDDEMLPQLLALGDAVEVLEPAAMRKRIAETAAAIAARYAGRPRAAVSRLPASG